MNFSLQISYNDFVQTKNQNKCCLFDQKIHTLFVLGCGYGIKYLNAITYKWLSNQISKEEIISVVYFSLVYALNKYHWKKDRLGKNFKNFFYLIIRYRCIYEVKQANNWKHQLAVKAIIKQPLALKANLVVDLLDSDQKPIDEQIAIIRQFLRKKKPLYLAIVNDRLNGLTHKEIAEKQKTTEQIIKAKFRYIKKIIRDELACLHYGKEVF